MMWSNSMTLERYKRRMPLLPRWAIWVYALVLVAMMIDMRLFDGTRHSWIVTRSLLLEDVLGTVGAIVVVYGYILLGAWVIYTVVRR